MKGFVFTCALAIVCILGGQKAHAASIAGAMERGDQAGLLFEGDGRLVGSTRKTVASDGDLAGYSFSIEDDAGLRYDINIDVPAGVARVDMEDVAFERVPVPAQYIDWLKKNLHPSAQTKSIGCQVDCDTSWAGHRPDRQCRLARLPDGGEVTICDGVVQCEIMCWTIIAIGVGVAGLAYDIYSDSQNCRNQVARDTAFARAEGERTCGQINRSRTDVFRQPYVVPHFSPARPDSCIGEIFLGCRNM